MRRGPRPTRAGPRRNRSGPELVDEIQAGFADVAIAPTGASVLTVVATRP